MSLTTEQKVEAIFITLIIIFVTGYLLFERPQQLETINTKPTSPYQSYTGSLSVSSDNAYLYINNAYVGRDSVYYFNIAPGRYYVIAEDSNGNICWERSTQVYAGKQSIINDNTYCR